VAAPRYPAIPTALRSKPPAAMATVACPCGA
jgi:hypothetical protein